MNPNRPRGTTSNRAPARSAALLAVSLATAFLLAACTGPSARTTFPPLGVTPPPAGEATAAARAEVIKALGEVGLQAVDSVRNYRPPEGPLLAAAPRSVLQATLPDDPTHGFIVLYAFASPTAAGAAARDHADYLSTNTTKSLYPFGTRFVLRVVGSTVVFFHWSPEVSTDARTPEIEDALFRIGSGVPVPA